MPKSPLSPMLVQYLIGLCCLKWHPEAVNVTLGDMVLDPAADKQRDVDVTVTISDPEGGVYAFKAYEVKNERKALDVIDVEQLCIKLLDMPSVTHRSIVSASGFTEGAKAKAKRHGIELYELCPWTRPLQEQFPALTMQGTADECFPMSQILLCWNDAQYSLVARSAQANFDVQSSDKLFDASGNDHPKFKIFSEYQEEISLRSTEILFTLEPAAKLSRTFPIPYTASEGYIPAGPAWPHTHTLDVHQDGVYVRAGENVVRIDMVTINGYLQWQRNKNNGLYYIMS